MSSFIAGFGIGFISGIIALGIIGYIVWKKLMKENHYIELNHMGRVKST